MTFQSKSIKTSVFRGRSNFPLKVSKWNFLNKNAVIFMLTFFLPIISWVDYWETLHFQVIVLISFFWSNNIRHWLWLCFKFQSKSIKMTFLINYILRWLYGHLKFPRKSANITPFKQISDVTIIEVLQIFKQRFQNDLFYQLYLVVIVGSLQIST